MMWLLENLQSNSFALILGKDIENSLRGGQQYQVCSSYSFGTKGLNTRLKQPCICYWTFYRQCTVLGTVILLSAGRYLFHCKSQGFPRQHSQVTLRFPEFSSLSSVLCLEGGQLRKLASQLFTLFRDELKIPSISLNSFES